MIPTFLKKYIFLYQIRKIIRSKELENVYVHFLDLFLPVYENRHLSNYVNRNFSSEIKSFCFFDFTDKYGFGKHFFVDDKTLERIYYYAVKNSNKGIDTINPLIHLMVSLVYIFFELKEDKKNIFCFLKELDVNLSNILNADDIQDLLEYDIINTFKNKDIVCEFYFILLVNKIRILEQNKFDVKSDMKFFNKTQFSSEKISILISEKIYDFYLLTETNRYIHRFYTEKYLLSSVNKDSYWKSFSFVSDFSYDRNFPNQIFISKKTFKYEDFYYNHTYCLYVFLNIHFLISGETLKRLKLVLLDFNPDNDFDGNSHENRIALDVEDIYIIDSDNVPFFSEYFYHISPDFLENILINLKNNDLETFILKESLKKEILKNEKIKFLTNDLVEE